MPLLEEAGQRRDKNGLEQWWRTYGTRARGGTQSPLCGHAHHHPSTVFITRKPQGRGAGLLPSPSPCMPEDISDFTRPSAQQSNGSASSLPCLG